MKVLAIESSAVTASVAIMTEDTLIAEYTINYKKTAFYISVRDNYIKKF